MQRIGEFEFGSKLLGHGAFALVFRGQRIKDGLPVAVKQIKLQNVPGRLSDIKQREIDILKDLRHPNIVQLYDYRDGRSDVYLVMEYCNGGDLGGYLKDKRTLSEDSIRILTRHIAGALEVLVSHQIIHRDIKPQNLLLSYPSGGTKKEMSFRDVTIKLADFGFARHLAGTDMAATLCGSPLYMAPEILLGRRYDNKADLWSVGTILFQCLSGKAPFFAEDPHALRKKYQREKLIPKIPTGTSHPLSQLLTSLLCKDPGTRLPFDGFFTHPFLNDVSPDPTPLLSQHVKSSPVSIQRHRHQSQQQLASPHRGSSVDMYSLSPSSASGPPLSHQIGSHGSLSYLSPNPDITDQGFILVDLPLNSGSRRYTRSNSTSPGTHTPSSAHTTHSSTHTPSSLGSLTRYNSLTMPFYQTRPSQDTPCSTTPTNIDTSSGYHSRTHGGSLSRSNSGRGKLPFGQLISQPPLTLSSHRHSLTNSPSPLSTPPSSLTSNQIRAAGIRYSLPTHGSAGRLSSLVEGEISRGAKGGSKQGNKERNNTYEITASCVLVSDEEDGNSPTDDYSLGLNMSFSRSIEDLEGMTSIEVAQNTTKSDALTLEGSRNRSSSFTQRNSQLFQDLASIRNRSNSLGKERGSEEVTFGGSESPEIASFQLPFLFPPTTAEERSDKTSSSYRDGVPCSCLTGLSDSLVIGRELVAMAQARQGPIMLLSTSTNLSGSGVGSRSQRCSEQLVLYAKAVSVLEASLVVYELNMATGNKEPSPRHRQIESEARQLVGVCLEKAQLVRDQLSECGNNGSLGQVSAEKLLYLEALDMCKAAVLDEKSGEANECIKRYRRAKLIFQHLLISASSQRDKALLHKYVSTSQRRVELLLSLSSY